MSVKDYVSLSRDRKIKLIPANSSNNRQPLEVKAIVEFTLNPENRTLEDAIYRVDTMLLNKARTINEHAFVVSVHYSICNPLIYATGIPVIEVPRDTLN